MKLKGIFAQSTILIKIILIAFVALLGLFCSAALAQLLAMIFYPGHSMSSVPVLRLFQVAQSVGVFIFPSLMVPYLTTNSVCNFLSLRYKPDSRIIVSTIAFMLLAIPVINFLADVNAEIKLPSFLHKVEEWMKQSEQAAKGITERFMQTSSWGVLFVNICIMAVLPAISEEFFFRGLLQTNFVQWFGNKHVAVWLTAFLFSAIHLQFYGFIPRFLLGAYLGYILIWSGSIWVPVLAHFIQNFLAVFFYFLYYNNYFTYDVDQIGLNDTLFVTIINCLLLTGIVWYQYKSKEYSK